MRGKKEVTWLRDLVLDATGLSEKKFHGRKWHQVLARHVFSFFARQWLGMSTREIANVLKRDRSTISDGIQALVDLIAGNTKTEFGDKGRQERADLARRWIAMIQMARTK